MNVVGGGTRWTNEVIRHLRIRGHEILLINDDRKGPRFLPRSYQEVWMARKLAGQLKRVKGLDCILLCSDMELSPVFKGVAPLVGILHESSFLKRLNVYGLRRLMQAPARYMGYMDFSALDTVVVNSHFTASTVKKVFPETHVVYPGIDHCRFTPEGSVDGGFLLYVARFSPGTKNHELAIEVAKSLKTRLVLAGGLGSVDYLNKLPHVGGVEFQPDVSDEELLQLYRNCSIYLHPSIAEAFGLTVVEAMACGKPVIAHKEGGGAREIVEDYGLVAGSIEEWIELTEHLLSSPQERKLIGEKCRNRALIFGWDRTAEDLETVIERII